jgi:GxxExxY protein
MVDRHEHLKPLTEKIIGCMFKVANSLGCGFLEKVYENALAHELRKAGLRVLQQHPIPVFYDGVLVGDYFADLLIDDVILVELKAVSSFDNVHYAQCLNYLKGTGLPICLPVNFGNPKILVKRFAN